MVNLTQRSMCLLLRCYQLIFLSIQIKFISVAFFVKTVRSAIRSSPVPLHKCDLIKLNLVAQNEFSHAAISLAYATTEEMFIAEFGTQGRFLMMTCFKLDTFEMSVICI